jgi:four helix bundle suffix protein
MSEIVYDATIIFCDRFIDRRSRTHDQMVQAARSGKQNIAEGSMASGTSKKTELKLVGVARASLEELLLDFQDFLRQRRLPLWGKEHEQALAVRKLAYSKNRSYETYKTYVEQSSPEVAANALICLIHQTNYLLDQQLRALEKAFLKEGGFTERLYRARSEKRNNRTQE